MRQNRFKRAMLPSCAGLTPDAETRRLATEAVQIYAKLGEALDGYRPSRDHAESLLAEIRQTLA